MSQGYGAPVPGCNQQQLIVWWLNAGECNVYTAASKGIVGAPLGATAWVTSTLLQQKLLSIVICV